MKRILLVAWLGGALAASARDIPFPNALNRAVVLQKPMTAEIPGSVILGNGDLNGILWVHQGRLRFSITKNDACDGRLDTANDPELCRIDIKKHSWTTPPGSGNPPSWDKPYPCPLICGHVEFGKAGPAWRIPRPHAHATVGYDETVQQLIALIKGKAGDSAGWGFVPKVAGPAKRATARLSGSSNARWYLDFPGTGVKSGWQPATRDAAEAAFAFPAGTTLEGIDLYVWTNDGQPAEIRLHSVAVDAEKQPLEGVKTLAASRFDARLDLARAVGIVTSAEGGHLTARVLAGRNAVTFETADAISLTPCAASFIPASKRGKQNAVEWILTTVPSDLDWPGMSFALAHAARGTRHVMAIVTSRKAQDPVGAAVTLAESVLGENEPQQIAAHEAAWRAFFKDRQMPSGFLMLQGESYGDDTRGNYSEQMAAAGIVSELLLQSVHDILRVFPCWPKDKDAKFVDLRAQGGFLVSAEQSGGQVKFVNVRSTVSGRLKFLNPWSTLPQARKNGAPVSLTDEGRGVLALHTKADDVVALNPQP